MAKLLGTTLVAVVACVSFWPAGCAKNQDLKLEVQNRRPVAWVNESARNIPVAYDVDVVVVGGTSGGVAAAVAAAQQGAKVFLAAERPYLGDDLCGTYRLWLEPGEEPDSPLAEKLFAEPTAARRLKSASETYRVPPTPMQVKRTLDESLLQAGVEFLFGCYATDVLYDSEGKPAGIVMANRTGRQAVKAKVIIDATPRASVARMAGAVFRPYPMGPQTFKRVVVGGEAVETEEVLARKMPTPLLTGQGAGYQAIEYTLKIAMADGSFASFAEAEQFARDKTWHPKQGDDSETLFQVPPDPMKGRKSLPGVWPGVEKVSLDVFRPAGVSRLFVLGGCADVSRDAAEKLLRPLELIKVGSRIGAAAASEAGSIGKLSDVKLPGNSVKAAISGEVRENLAWRRPTQTERGSIVAEARAVPVVAQYDVVVVGGGTGGAPAGIGAARQ
ncbi:MAG: FAD-dependent oxidoreductase, partial [Sedimentisphaerales bacterium]|nr:FAD-dependent oxidoreductase [Sedimentisphaerales bacterium]